MKKLLRIASSMLQIVCYMHSKTRKLRQTSSGTFGLQRGLLRTIYMVGRFSPDLKNDPFFMQNSDQIFLEHLKSLDCER